MLRKVMISTALIVVLLGIGGGITYRLIETKPKAPQSDDVKSPLLVRGLRLEPRTVVEPILGYGTAQADRYARVAAQVAGEVIELSPVFHVGSAVEAGELLVRIDDRDYQRQLDRARARVAADEAQLKLLDIQQRSVDRLIEIATNELDIAQREYERVLGLFEAKQAPRREVDLARQNHERTRRALQTLENQKAALPQQRAAQTATRTLHEGDVELAKLAVERCRVHAPFAGRLESIEVEIGERVNVGTLLFALLDPILIEVPIELPISRRERVEEGTACQLMLESNPGAVWSGRVVRISPQANQSTRTFSLFVEVDNTRQQHALMPGAFVRARIAGPTWSDALIVPRGIIEQGQVFVFQDGVARRQRVEVRRHMFDETIVGGLRPGQTVITSNLDALFDGAPVRVKYDTALAGSETPGPEDDESAVGASPESGAVHGS